MKYLIEKIHPGTMPPKKKFRFCLFLRWGETGSEMKQDQLGVGNSQQVMDDRPKPTVHQLRKLSFPLG